MPNLTGIEILRHIRKQKNEIPFILIIDYQSQGVIIDALKAGADDYVIIDVAFEEMLPCVVKKNIRFIEMKKKYDYLLNELQKTQTEVKDINIHDELTGLWNGRYIVKRLEEENARVKRYDRPLSVLLIDVDHFSDINKEYGRQMGDLILQKIAVIMQNIVRKVDAIGRYTGDEFLVILPETPVEKSSVVAEKILESVRKHIFNSKGSKFQVTLSIGISWSPRFGRENYEELLSAGGKALFSAKNEGYNRVNVAGKYK